MDPMGYLTMIQLRLEKRQDMSKPTVVKKGRPCNEHDDLQYIGQSNRSNPPTIINQLVFLKLPKWDRQTVHDCFSPAAKGHKKKA